jgi:hypothetical protein
MKYASSAKDEAYFFLQIPTRELSLQRLEKMIFKKKKSTHLITIYVKQTLVKRHLQQ